VKDATISTLASDVSAKLQALKGLKSRLADVQVCQTAGIVLVSHADISFDVGRPHPSPGGFSSWSWHLLPQLTQCAWTLSMHINCHALC
jgi:hypothetical protein